MDKMLILLDTYKYSLIVTFLSLSVFGYAFLKVKKSAISHVKDCYDDKLVKADLFLAATTTPSVSFNNVYDVSVYDDEVFITASSESMAILGPLDYLVAIGKPTPCLKKRSYKVDVYASGVLLLSETVFEFTTSENFGFVGYLSDGSDICVCLGRNLTLVVT